jgi:DNA-directed RNA polymerase specialized sigma24 family protein
MSSLPDGFASTEWSLVLTASTDGGPALDRLCGTYWKPVYVFIRASGLPPAEAEDATQEFFADMLRREWLKVVDRDRGSFRAFLRSSVRLFLQNRRRHQQAKKRGGGASLVPLDTAEGERELARLSSTRTDPCQHYESAWADCVVAAALERLGEEQQRAGKAALFAQLRPFLTAAPAPGDYGRVAADVGLAPGQVAVTVHRLSRRLAELIRAEIAGTLLDPRELETELRYLLQLAARSA